MIRQITESESGNRQTYAPGAEGLRMMQFKVFDRTPDELEQILCKMNDAKSKPHGVIIFEFIMSDSFQVLYDYNQSTETEILDYIKTFSI